MTPQTLRDRCAESLLLNSNRVPQLRTFVGFDGFVDEIAHAVDKRESPERYHRLATITQFAGRVGAAAGHSTNIELVTQQIKLGGNGPIMANALASFGLRVTYLGALGYPQIHPAFSDFAQRASVHSIAPPGQTTALEFSDGKIMLVRGSALNEVNWQNIADRFGADRFLEHVRASELLAFVNWTELPHLEEVWRSLQEQLAQPTGSPSTPTGRSSHEKRQLLFVDLADPEKRDRSELRRALQVVAKFEDHFDVALGLNEKEARQVAAVVGLESQTDLKALVPALRARLSVSELLVHPLSYALLATPDLLLRQDGPRIERPVLSTGGGDHFNAGYCLGRLLDLGPESSLLLAVATSGFYVGQGRTPTVPDLAAFLRAW
jgi:sugar/nucleoside kinase (ribokinase family)